MFVVLLTYTAPLDQIDAHLEEHVRYLKRQYEAGVFLASGRRVPRTGGVILAKAQSLDAMWEVLAQDPFHQHGVARYEVIEFTPSLAQPYLAELVES